MGCQCSCGCKNAKPKSTNTLLWMFGTLAALSLWALAYSQLGAFSLAVASLLPIPGEGRLHEAASFFFLDVPKVFLLLILIVFVMGVIRSFFSPARTRALLAGRAGALGNAAAASLGVVTPFCSCSAVPLFIGFLSAGVPLGVAFSFIISAPMVNEVALGLLFGLVGWKIALTYLLFGFSIAVASGWIIGRLDLEDWLEEWVKNARADAADPCETTATSFPDRIKAGLGAVKDIVSKVWLWVLFGIAAGAFIHGYVPSELLASVMGNGKWWSIPAVVLLGIPMYANHAGIVPVAEALLGKGATIGAVLAFMMSVTALSLPETIILRKVLSPRLIAVFLGVVGTGIIAVGFLFNALFG